LKNWGLSINDVDVGVFRDFLQRIIYERMAKCKTVENYFSALSAFYDCLAFEGCVASNIILLFRKRNKAIATLLANRDKEGRAFKA